MRVTAADRRRAELAHRETALVAEADVRTGWVMDSAPPEMVPLMRGMRPAVQEGMAWCMRRHLTPFETAVVIGGAVAARVYALDDVPPSWRRVGSEQAMALRVREVVHRALGGPAADAVLLLARRMPAMGPPVRGVFERHRRVAEDTIASLIREGVDGRGFDERLTDALLEAMEAAGEPTEGMETGLDAEACALRPRRPLDAFL